MKEPKPENHKIAFRDRGWIDCAVLFLKEKVFSIPAQVMYATFIMFVIGYFSPSVSDEKFRLLCSTLQWIFGIYAGGGLGVMIAKNKKAAGNGK
jgi:hypothetical protein